MKEEKGITPYPRQVRLSLISGYLEARHPVPIHKIKGVYTPSQGCTRLVPTSTALPRAFTIISIFLNDMAWKKKIEKNDLVYLGSDHQLSRFKITRSV